MLNQQGVWVLQPGWRSSRTGQSLADLVQAGHTFLICDNTAIPLPDQSGNEVLTNNVPVDVATWLGPGVQSNEIRRILKSGGRWLHNRVVQSTKP